MSDDPHGAFDGGDVAALGAISSGDTTKVPRDRNGWGDGTPANSNCLDC